MRGMRVFEAALVFALCFVWGGVAWAIEPVNAVLGDESWVATHGVEPGARAGEVERIQTHLRYVIEGLERADVSGLSQAQRVNRARALVGLSEYVEGGEFPRRDAGDGWVGRRPQFIDSRGVHCAVGEMLRRTGHGELAKRIDGEHEFSFVPDIDTSGLSQWATDFGFTTRELAMIQPNYGGEDWSEDHVHGFRPEPEPWPEVWHLWLVAFVMLAVVVVMWRMSRGGSAPEDAYRSEQ